MSNLSPYADQLGLRIIERSDATALFELPGAERFVGNPVLSAFHGGIICGAMSCCMLLQLMERHNLEVEPALVNQTTSFLGSTSTQQSIFIKTEITKPGKRILGASCRAFQNTESQLVAKTSALFKISGQVA